MYKLWGLDDDIDDLDLFLVNHSRLVNTKANLKWLMWREYMSCIECEDWEGAKYIKQLQKKCYALFAEYERLCIRDAG